MSEIVRVRASGETTTSYNHAKEPTTILFNLVHHLKAGQFKEVIQSTPLDDPELRKLHEALKELAVIMERDSYELSILSRQVRVFMENIEDKDRTALRVS